MMKNAVDTIRKAFGLETNPFIFGGSRPGDNNRERGQRRGRNNRLFGGGERSTDTLFFGRSYRRP